MIHLINRFGTDIIVIRNDGGFVNIDGYMKQVKKDTKIGIRASVQPATPEDLQMLPEGSDTKEVIKLFTIEKLIPRQGNPPMKGDFFCIHNCYYEVIATKDYTSHHTMNIFYYMVLGIKVAYDS